MERENHKNWDRFRPSDLMISRPTTFNDPCAAMIKRRYSGPSPPDLAIHDAPCVLVLKKQSYIEKIKNIFDLYKLVSHKAVLRKEKYLKN